MSIRNNMRTIKEEQLLKIVKRKHADTIKRIWKMRMKNFGQTIDHLLQTKMKLTLTISSRIMIDSMNQKALRVLKGFLLL